jgi:hypothetical protein
MHDILMMLGIGAIIGLCIGLGAVFGFRSGVKGCIEKIDRETEELKKRNARFWNSDHV